MLGLSMETMLAGLSMRLRKVAGIWLLFAWAGWCFAAEDPTPAPPVYQFLVMVETSEAMVRQKEVALDTIHELLLTGFYNRIHRGDVLGIWPFNKEVNQKFTRPIHWSAVEARDLSNFVYRKLRDIEFSDKSELVLALAAAKTEAGRSEQLIVLLVTSGEQMVQGTPFDAEINAVFQQHGSAMSKARRPFVTVLVFEKGEVVAQGVTPGGRAVYIPPRPSIATSAVEEPVLTAPDPHDDPPAPEPAVRPAPMSVEEIAAKLREAQVQKIRNREGQVSAETGVVSLPAESNQTAPADPVVAEESSVGAAAVAVEDRTETQPAATPEIEMEAPVVALEQEKEGISAEEQPVQPVLDAVEPPSEVALEPAEVFEEVEPVTEAAMEGEAGRESLEEPSAGGVEHIPSEEDMDVASAEVADPIAQGLVLPPDGGRQGRMIYLGVGVVLSVLAVVLILWRLWRPRHRGRASVISQSMYRK